MHFLFQPSLSSDNLPRPSSSNPCPEQPRSSQDCGEYPTSSLVSDAMPYMLQSYPDPSVSVALTSPVEQPSSASVPFLYPLSCHKFGYYSPSSVTSTVITHTGSSMGSPGLVPQPHTYAHTGSAYPQTVCHSLGYPAGMSDPPHAVLPSVTARHCFSVPEQVAGTEGRGKHKQKTGGVSAVALPAPAGSTSTAHTSTSCLAKLLSSRTPERESSCVTTYICAAPSTWG